MAEAEEASGETGGETSPPKPKISLQAILLLANAVLLLVAVGTAVYTRLLFKRPAISESEEYKKRIEEAKNPPLPAEKAILTFDPLTVNIAMTSGKAHYASLSFAIECKNNEACEVVKKRKPQFLDIVVQTLAKKQITEINTVHGRLFLKSELLKQFNKVMDTSQFGHSPITDLYISDLTLQ
ncbi:MAG: flagellar basal body-associated protein FliL [Bacteriovoracia bacterium]